MTHGGEQESAGNRHGEFPEKAKRVMLLKLPVNGRLLNMSAEKQYMHHDCNNFNYLGQDH